MAQLLTWVWLVQVLWLQGMMWHHFTLLNVRGKSTREHQDSDPKLERDFHNLGFLLQLPVMCLVAALPSKLLSCHMSLFASMACKGTRYCVDSGCTASFGFRC
jgi:hypothetical protein